MRLRRFFSAVLAMFVVSACSGAPPGAQDDGTFLVATTPPTVDLAEQGQVDVKASDGEVAAAGLPLGLDLAQFYDFSLTDGSIPESGAILKFHLDAPLEDGQVAAVARWLPVEELWEPLESSVSDDGINVSARTEHFSEYGVVLSFMEKLDLGQRLLFGNAAEPPTCDIAGLTGEEPAWSDAQFFEDKLSPTLWCVSGVQGEPDQLAVRFVWSRATAARIRTGIEPLADSNDFLDSDIATQLLSGLAYAGPSIDHSPREFLVQPLGEYTFIFERDKLNEYYAQQASEPLIEVSTNMGYTVLGLAYDELMRLTTPTVAATLVVLSAGSCPDLTKNGQLEVLISLAVDCLGSLTDARGIVERLVTEPALLEPVDLTSLTTQASRGAKILKSFLGYFKLFQISHMLTSALTDAQLHEVTRQLQYTPSMNEILRLASVRLTEEFNACSLVGDEIPYGESPGLGQCWYLNPLDIEHPHYGDVQFVVGTIQAEIYSVRNAYWLLDTDGQVLQRRLGEEDLAWSISAPELDGSGNIRYTYNPGRSDGCVALRPEGEWFNGFGTDPLQVPDGTMDYLTRFYGCIWHDIDQDGTLEVIYQPSGGANYYEDPKIYRWNGEDYEFAGVSSIGIYGESRLDE